MADRKGSIPTGIEATRALLGMETTSTNPVVVGGNVAQEVSSKIKARVPLGLKVSPPRQLVDAPTVKVEAVLVLVLIAATRLSAMLVAYTHAPSGVAVSTPDGNPMGTVVTTASLATL